MRSYPVEKENSNEIELYEKAGFISEGKSNEYGEVIYRYVCGGKNGI